MKIPFVGPCYKGRSAYWDGQDTVNLYLEADEAGGKSSLALLGTPGLVPWITLSSAGGEVRGAMACADGYLYAVCGAVLSRVSTAGEIITLGSLETSSGPVSMAQNGSQLLIGDGPYGYLVTFATGTFGRIIDANFPSAAAVAFVDGYFAVLKQDSEQWFLSGLYDGTVWDGLTYASAQGAPDKLMALVVSHREVWLLGEQSTEVWYDTAAAPPSFPFERISGAFIEAGCAARNSALPMDNTVVWLTDKGQVVRASGYAPQIISTRQMESLIEGYPRRDDAFAFTYTQAGHTFYALTFPTADVTWVYDAATGAWHRRKSWGMGRWRASCYVRFNGMHLVGDMSTGKLHRLDLDANTEDGEILEAMRVTPPMSSPGGERLFMASLQVDFEPGVGTATGQGQDPQAMLDWSDDGGRTWSNVYTAPMGKMGEYRTRTIWRRLGSFRNRSFRLRITDPVKRVIVGASATITKGAN